MASSVAELTASHVVAVSQIKKKGSTTGYMLRCPGCRRKKSTSKDSFFDGSHLTLAKILALMYFWRRRQVSPRPRSMSECRQQQWYQYFRDICSWKLLRTPASLGGQGKIVQIDESVMVKAKYHRGRQLRE